MNPVNSIWDIQNQKSKDNSENIVMLGAGLGKSISFASILNEKKDELNEIGEERYNEKYDIQFER